jgi:hypothetical protein
MQLIVEPLTEESVAADHTPDPVAGEGVRPARIILDEIF